MFRQRKESAFIYNGNEFLCNQVEEEEAAAVIEKGNENDNDRC
jgi:hypothetical protein